MTTVILERFWPYLLSRATRRASAGFAARLGERFGLSTAEWRILAHLSRDDAVSVRDLSIHADLEKSKASRACDRLEAKGFVIKNPSPNDGRLVALSLSARGVALLEELAPIAASYNAELEQKLSPGERRALASALRRLAED